MLPTIDVPSSVTPLRTKVLVVIGDQHRLDVRSLDVGKVHGHRVRLDVPLPVGTRSWSVQPARQAHVTGLMILNVRGRQWRPGQRSLGGFPGGFAVPRRQPCQGDGPGAIVQLADVDGGFDTRAPRGRLP